MTMTKQHFQLVAEVIAEMPTFAISLRSAKRSTAIAFAERFSREFPLFDADRFLAACDVGVMND